MKVSTCRDHSRMYYYRVFGVLEAAARTSDDGAILQIVSLFSLFFLSAISFTLCNTAILLFEFCLLKLIQWRGMNYYNTRTTKVFIY